MHNMTPGAALISALLSVLILLLGYMARQNNAQSATTALALKAVTDQLVILDREHAVTRERVENHLDWAQRTITPEGYPRNPPQMHPERGEMRRRDRG